MNFEFHIYEGKLKSSYDDISTVNDFFDQWDLSTASSMKEMHRPQEDYVEK